MDRVVLETKLSTPQVTSGKAVMLKTVGDYLGAGHTSPISALLTELQRNPYGLPKGVFTVLKSLPFLKEQERELLYSSV